MIQPKNWQDYYEGVEDILDLKDGYYFKHGHLNYAVEIVEIEKGCYGKCLIWDIESGDIEPDIGELVRFNENGEHVECQFDLFVGYKYHVLDQKAHVQMFEADLYLEAHKLVQEFAIKLVLEKGGITFL